MITPDPVETTLTDIADAFHRLADGLGGSTGSSEAGRAARDLAALFATLVQQRAMEYCVQRREGSSGAGGDPMWTARRAPGVAEPGDVIAAVDRDWRTHGVRGEDPRSW